MAAAIVLFTAAAVIFGFGPAYLLIRARLHDRAWEAEHTDSLPADDEWMALLAVTDEPIFARLMAESLRRDLEEWDG